MNYFLSEEGYHVKKFASSKPRNDCSRIMQKMGFKRLNYETIFGDKNNFIRRLTANFKRFENLKKITSILRSGDCLVIQHPLFRPTFFLKFLISKLNKKGINTIAIVHDLNYFRTSEVSFLKKKWLYDKDISTLIRYKHVIVHNNSMKKKLTEYGLDSQKMINLGIFDYLVSEKDGLLKKNNYNGSVTIAGNLDIIKAEYCYHLPSETIFNLYGVNYNSNISMNGNNVKYKGSFMPDQISSLHGDFGLIWDGNSIKTCSGQFGQYLKINNPHKASLYLAAGLPVFIWKEAALSKFICKNKLGFAINNLNEISQILGNLDFSEYLLFKKNVSDISRKIKSGYFLTAALKKAISE